MYSAGQLNYLNRIVEYVSRLHLAVSLIWKTVSLIIVPLVFGSNMLEQSPVLLENRGLK